MRNDWINFVLFLVLVVRRPWCDAWYDDQINVVNNSNISVEATDINNTKIRNDIWVNSWCKFRLQLQLIERLRHFYIVFPEAPLDVPTLGNSEFDWNVFEIQKNREKLNKNQFVSTGMRRSYLQLFAISPKSRAGSELIK